MRGWLHAYAALISLASGVTLIAVAAATRGAAAGWSASIYAATVTLLFGTSALYHRVRWSPVAQRRMKRADHSMIFVFIAGSYTPLATLAPQPLVCEKLPVVAIWLMVTARGPLLVRVTA